MVDSFSLMMIRIEANDAGLGSDASTFALEYGIS